MMQITKNFPSLVPQTQEGPLSKERLSNKYSPRLLRALEYIYGTEGIISSGGTTSVDALFSDVDLNGKSLLDVGCGFGGVDLYLASNFDVSITGVEHERYMHECANHLKQRSHTTLKGDVSFQLTAHPFSLGEFQDKTFDYVMCKQVLYHLSVKDRTRYLKEMHRVLKPGGMLLIEDWLVAFEPYSELVQKALNVKNVKSHHDLSNAFCYLITPEDFSSILTEAGFKKVEFTDYTNEQVENTKNDIERLKESEEPFKQELGAETYQYYLESWGHLCRALEAHEMISRIVKCTT